MLSSGACLIKVKDFNKCLEFYQELLNVQASSLTEGRWAGFNSFGLYCPAYDIEHNYDLTEFDKELTYGTNMTLVFSTDDIDLEYKRVKNIDIKAIT